MTGVVLPLCYNFLPELAVGRFATLALLPNSSEKAVTVAINAFLSEIRLHCERVFEQSVLGRLKTLSFLCVFTASLGGKSVAKTTKARASKTLRNNVVRNAMSHVKPVPKWMRLSIFRAGPGACFVPSMMLLTTTRNGARLKRTFETICNGDTPSGVVSPPLGPTGRGTRHGSV